MKNILALIALIPHASSQVTNATRAVVVLTGSSGVNGTVVFEQAGPDAPVSITGKIYGLASNVSRGLHVHQFGNLTNGCNSTGGHFNPTGKNHGGRTAPERHVGDLGNIQTDGYGVATLNFSDGVISVSGSSSNSIIGRALAVHNGTDDLGLGNSTDSLTTGASGARVACGVIGIAA